MTIKGGKNARTYKVTYVQHDLCGDVEVTRFSIGDQYDTYDGHKRMAYVRVTVWDNLPIVDGDEIRLLYYYDFSINEKAKKNPGGTVVGIPIYSMSAKVEVVNKDEKAV